MSILRMGIIGYGGMAHWHQERVRLVDGIEVVGVYDVLPAQRQKGEADGYLAYPSRDALLADERINCVLVATPNHVHKENVIAALDAGKHVICEKPVTLTVADLDEMIAASRRNEKLFTVHQNRRWDHDYLVAKEVFRSGALGEVYTVQSCLSGTGGLINGWRAFPEYGGGMVYDWGVHFLDQLLDMIPGRILTVFADLHSVKNSLVDDYFHISLKFDSGLSVITELGTFMLRSKPRWYMAGNGGTMVINSFDGADGIITKVSKLAEAVEPVIVQTDAGPTRTFAPQPPETREDFPLPELIRDKTAFYRNVRDAIAGKENLIVRPEQVRRVLSLIEAVFVSAREGRSIPFEEKEIVWRES